MRLAKTLYVNGHRTKIGLQKGALILSDPDKGKSRVPITAIDGLILLGNSQMTTQAFAECISRGVRVASLSRGGKLRFTVGGPTSGNVYLRISQMRASESTEHSLDIARACVGGKVLNARKLVQRWSWDSPREVKWTFTETVEILTDRIHEIGSASSMDRLRGLEGDAARRYFQAMRAALWQTGWVFGTRTRRPPRDPVNSLLSFTYALLISETVGALESVGLDPQIGFLHGIRPGRPSLALDLVEEFRPSVADRMVVGALRRRQFDDSDFVYTPGGACYLSDQGRSRLLRMWETRRDEDIEHPLLARSIPRANLPSIQSTILARHLRGDLPAYAPYLMGS
jgi:CRISP-associated protein Cas1